MNDDREFEALLRGALGRRGEPAPFPIDVSARVMTRVALLGAPPRKELDLHQFRRWAAAAAALGAVLLTAVAWQGPDVLGLASALGQAVAGATGAALKLGAPAEALAGTLRRLALAFLASAQAVASPLEPLKPLAQAMVAAATALMLAVTTFVLGRDATRRTVADKEQA